MAVSQTIRSLEKALDLIEALSRDGGEAGVSEFGRRLGLSKNQVFRILSTLKKYGYVYQTPQRTYRLGSRFIEIGQQLIDRNDLVQIALPLMDELRNATGESVHLFIRDGLRAMCIARRESPAPIKLSAHVGERALVHAGACPGAIFAFQPPAIVDAAVERYGLPAYTERTIVDRPALDRRLAEIRARGYAESCEEVDRYALSIAIPIFDATGSVTAAMSVAGPSHRFTEEKRAQALSLLVDARERIREAMGGPSSPIDVAAEGAALPAAGSGEMPDT